MFKGFGFRDGGESGSGAPPAPVTGAAAFRIFDKDGSGFLNVQEIRAILQRPGDGCEPLSDDLVKEIIAEFDTNGDGLLNYKEFAVARASTRVE